MGLTENVTVVALVVSLSALMIAFGQLSQQLLGTAEGYRRCSEAVMGPWHRLRWRHWVWSEFRLETHFITPKILLYAFNAGDDEDDVLTNANALALSDVANAADHAHVSWRRPWLFFLPRRESDMLPQALEVLSETLRKDEKYSVTGEETRDDSGNSSADVEKGRDTNERATKRFSKTRRSDVKATLTLQSENKVSWLELLHRLSNNYASHQCKSQLTIRWVADRLGADISNDANWNSSLVWRSAGKANGRSTGDSGLGVGTEVAVTFTDWTWDIMPNDVSRPLATTTLGALIVFAVRLGMQWRSLDLTSSTSVHADGNGYVISAIDVPGLGLIAKLSVTGQPKCYSALSRSLTTELVPGRAADKLMCGIIPVCKGLVNQDLIYVSDDRKLATWTKFSEWISLPQDMFKIMKSRPIAESINEVLTLLYEFLPVRRSKATTHCFWGWTGARRSVFHFYEGRLVLWRRLQDLKSEQWPHEYLKIVHGHLDRLKVEYEADFYCQRKDASIVLDETRKNDPVAQEKQMNLLQDCRSIFNWTTSWLLDNKFDKHDGEDPDRPTRYMHLVAAHCSMAHSVIPMGEKHLETLKKSPGWGPSRKREHYQLDEYHPKPDSWYNASISEFAKSYYEGLRHEEYGVVKYMHNREVELSANEIETAWWVVMLRGIAWDMSTFERRRGDAVPASLHNSSHPVWIT